MKEFSILSHFKYIIFTILFFGLLFLDTYAQSPLVKIDLNQTGRPEAEVNDPNYIPWITDNAVSTSKTVSGVTFTFKRVGSNGTNIKTDWYKAGLQAPYYAQLANDGIIVEGGDTGAQIELTISGLATGKHSIMTFHNICSSPAAGTFSPVDIYVNGALQINNLAPSIRAVTNDALVSSYLYFNATQGTSTVILYKAETGTSATIKNVNIAGFELNTPNVKQQSRNPTPNNGDEHYNIDNGSVTLSWAAAPNNASHHIYFGTDYNCVNSGTVGSSCYKTTQAGLTHNVSGIMSMETFYWRVDEVDKNGVVTKGNVWTFRPRHLAFPDAEGYGRFARGGRGGKVVYVTNLNDSGTGSLRAAVENDIGPRTIVFKVSGIITLLSRLTLTSSYVTVAGQTAPGKGICIRAAPFGMSGANDVIMQDIRVRLGAGQTFDGMGMSGSNNCIVDHCSISWTIDEAFSSRNGKNITLQRTLISEALNIAGHQNYPAGTAHGYAATISGDVGSFHHNLLAHCEGRNWSMGGGLDGNGNYSGRLDLFNNVVYNWNKRTTDGGAHEVNFVNNYYKPGAATHIFTALNAQYDNFPGTQRYYFSGNVMPGYFTEANQNAGKTYSGTPNGYSPWVTTPFFPSYATIQSAGDAYKSVLSDVGCNQPVFDDHDVRMVYETLTGTYKYKGSISALPGLPDKESDVGGYESYPALTRANNWDTDLDGLPDWWETNLGLNPNSGSGNFADANADPNNDGYTNLEDYLQWMANAHYIIATNSQTIDLAAMFKGYTSSPTYTASSIVNGTVAISGTTAIFNATKCGRASFKITVRDASGSTMTKNVGVFISAGCTAVTPIVAKKYIYTYDNSGNLSWTNTNNWIPKDVPTAIDTVIIRTGEVQIANLNHTAPMYVETNGTLRLIDTSTIANLRMQGGTLKAYTSAPGMMLTSAITVEQPSTIMAGSIAATVFTLNGTITGNANLTKTSVGNLRINSTATGFKGNWIIADGKIQLRSATGLGVCGVQVKSPARLDIEAAGASIYSLVLEDGAGVDLDQPLTTSVAVFGAINILTGAYQNAAYPTFIGSTNALTVSNSLVSLSGATTFCPGGNLILTAASGASYSWKNNAIQVGTTAAYISSTTGSYAVDATNSIGCKVTSAAIQTIVSVAQTPTITSSSTFICTGTSTVLTASAATSYKWLNGTIQVGTANTYTASTAGAYTVEVINANGCKATSATTTITVNANPTASITSTATYFCTGSSLVLNASAGTSYKWFNNGTQVETSATYTAANAGAYTVEVTNASGCKATSAVVHITESVAQTPTITSSSTSFCMGESVVLSASAGSSYKWFNETTQVGTANAYTASTNGSYTVEVTNASGCSSTSSAKQIIATATITWYADEDNDGVGNLSNTINACTKPNGYVATAGDACPTDANKTTAGNCGCENTETSCLDCNNTPNGTAILDNCSVCVGGTTGNTACLTTATSNGAIVNIQVAPQPFDASTSITMNNLGVIQSFTIISSSGALVDSKQGLNVDEIIIGESISSGLYTVIITTEKGIYTTKIVKK